MRGSPRLRLSDDAGLTGSMCACATGWLFARTNHTYIYDKNLYDFIHEQFLIKRE
jgi:hypothetical protein